MPPDESRTVPDNTAEVCAETHAEKSRNKMTLLRDNVSYRLHDLQQPKIINRLADWRGRHGFSAARLAAAAGISRQTIYAIEAGNYIPNTAVTLRLANVLGVRVEDLFQLPERPASPDIDFLDANFEPGMPVQVARVGNKLIAVCSAPTECYLPPMDTMITAGRQISIDKLDLENRIAIAGCDPAASILGQHLRTAGIEPVFVHRNSTESIALLKQGRVHVAGTHLRGKPPRGQFETFSFARWQEGLVVAHGNPKGIRSVADLARKHIRFVNRESGAGTRQLLDRALARLDIEPGQIRGYQQEAFGHLAAARQVAFGAADCCIATEAAARALGLDFVPLDTARYDFILRRVDVQMPNIQTLLNILHSNRFRRALEAVAGYDTSITGSTSTAGR
jgi:molybdate-binding protein/DNA-binding XRE family transcriptional regulator